MSTEPTKKSQAELVQMMMGMIREQSRPTNKGRKQVRNAAKIKRHDRSSYPVTGSNNSVRAIYNGPDRIEGTMPSQLAYRINPDEHTLTRNIGGSSVTPDNRSTVIWHARDITNRKVGPAYGTN